MSIRQLVRYSAVAHTPDAEMEERLPPEGPLGHAIFAIQVAISEHDASHPGALPDILDLTMVFRSTSTRIWLATATSDIEIPELVAAFASIPIVPIRRRSFALTVRLARDFDNAAVDHAPWLPCAWRAAAEGRAIDDLLDEISPT